LAAATPCCSILRKVYRIPAEAPLIISENFQRAGE
jgi:hypothetical protein